MTTATIDQNTEDTIIAPACPIAGRCTVEKCVNLNDPVAQADCELC